MTDEAIHFTMQVIKVQTMTDGGIRLTLDLSEKDIDAAAAMMKAKMMNALVECAAVFVLPQPVNVKEEDDRPSKRCSPYSKTKA